MTENATLSPEIKLLQKQLKEEQALREQMIRTPQMKLALEAIKEGKDLIVKEDKIEEPVRKVSLKKSLGGRSVDKLSPETINDFSMSEAINLMSDIVEDFVEARLEETVKNVSAPLEKRFSEVTNNQNKLAQAIIEQAKRTGSAMMHKTHQDFKAFEEEAFAYVEKYNIPLEEAYILVKAKNKDKVPDAKEIHVERPSIVPSRPRSNSSSEDAKANVHEIARSARKRLKDSINVAVEDIISRRQRQ